MDGAATVDTRPERGRHPVVRNPVVRAVAWSLLGSLVACILLVLAGLWAVNRAAADRAVAQARQLGELDARLAFGSYVTDALIDGDHAAYQAIDEVTRRYLLSSIAVRVKVWSEAQVIVYSDEPRLVGRHFEMEDTDVQVLRSGGSHADVTALDKAENVFETNKGRLLEVYVGVRTPSGRPALIESYFPYRLVDDNARDLRNRFTPVLLAGLVVLTAVQIPLALALSIRLHHNQRDRERLLHHLVSRSDIERRRIAAEVHDGAVQDLIGLGYGLAGAAEQADEPVQGKLRALSEGLSGTVRSLRGLLGSIYPVQVPPEGLATGIETLAADLRLDGVRVTVKVPESLGVSPTDELLLLRAARELLRNVGSHGQASDVQVSVTANRDRTTLIVRDDGVGFEPKQLDERRRQGHLGLRLLEDLAADAGGSFMITSSTELGTVARLELPAT